MSDKEKNMKKTAITLLLIGSAGLMSGCAPSFSKWKQKAAPDFTVTDIDGKTFTLSQQKGKDVIVVLLTTKCPFCKMEVSQLVKLRDSYDAASVAIIAISNEDNSVLREFRQARGINYTIASTQNLPSPYSDRTSIPMFFFVDRTGTIRDTAVGYHSAGSLESLVSEMDAAQK
jgi:peroxiredoxin